MIGDAGLVRAVIACRDRIRASARPAALLGWSLAELTLMAWRELRWRRARPGGLMAPCGGGRVAFVEFDAHGAVIEVIEVIDAGDLAPGGAS